MRKSLISILFHDWAEHLQAIATNLIVLGKALGADVITEVSQQPTSIIRFRHRQTNEVSEDCKVPVGFESQLATTLGGSAIETEATLEVKEVWDERDEKRFVINKVNEHSEKD